MPELELGFWKASVRAREMPGARDARSVSSMGLPMAVVSNTSFGERVIRYELEQHRLTEHLSFVMASSEYSMKTERAAVRDGGGAIEREGGGHLVRRRSTRHRRRGREGRGHEGVTSTTGRTIRRATSISL